jgi:thiaminase
MTDQPPERLERDVPFARRQRERVGDLWARMLAHEFLLRTRDGTISREAFARWLQQDYLFVEGGLRFLALLLGRAPREHRDVLADAIQALRAELRLFEERAHATGIAMGAVEPAFVTHAYLQFLAATAAVGSYEQGLTVLYVAERAYLESWRVVKEGIAEDSPWRPFVDNWTSEEFAAYVASLETLLDELAAGAGPREQAAMAEAFELTVRYELAFWDMALGGATWPSCD